MFIKDFIIGNGTYQNMADEQISSGFYWSYPGQAGLSIGLWLDERVFHTSFWFTITGLLIGLFVAFWGLYKALKVILRNDNS